MTPHQQNLVALLLRIGLGAIWLWSAIVSEFVAPRSLAYDLLAAVGITGALAPVALHGASLLDTLLGVLTLLGCFTRVVAVAQALLVVVYTLLLVGHVPELWAHPFAPIGKNVTLVMAACALAVVGGGAWSLDARLRLAAKGWGNP
jgi:uncharacterized membrane protein YphA (DoxX/SURF4 family)